ncbi:hypothetical protein MKX01_000658 [Papaver californicum]|nr:hypothetical protein MKX01_000658 [Papaver californicum]
MDLEYEYSDDGFDLDEERVRYLDKAKPEDNRQEKRYTILMQQADISQVSNTLSIPRVSATILFRHYNWDADKAQDAWFADEEKVRKDVGLLEKQVEVPIQNTENKIKYRVCLDEFPRDFIVLLLRLAGISFLICVGHNMLLLA